MKVRFGKTKPSIAKQCCCYRQLAFSFTKPAEGRVEAEDSLGFFSMDMLEHVFLRYENFTIKICGIKPE